MIAGRALWVRLRPSAPSQVHVPSVGDVLVLRPPRRTGVMLSIVAVMPAAVVVAFGVRAWATDMSAGGKAIATVAGLLAIGFTAHQFLTAFRQRVIVNEWGIERVG